MGIARNRLAFQLVSCDRFLWLYMLLVAPACLPVYVGIKKVDGCVHVVLYLCVFGSECRFNV